MPLRTSEATWEGALKDGHGTMKLGSGAYEGAFTFDSRFGAGKGTNPEELIAAAEAGCFSMALAFALSEAGHPAKKIHTVAKVHLEKSADGFSIPEIDVETEGEVPGIDAATFQQFAEKTKAGCPVSKVLAAAKINLTARLKS